MDKQKLIEYLEIVVELEKQKFIQERTLKKLDRTINSLGIKNTYIKPSLKKARSEDGSIGSSIMAGLFGGGFLGAIIGFVSCNPSAPGDLISNFLLKVVISGAIGATIMLIMDISIIITKNSQYKEEYNQQLISYDYNLRQDAARVEEENRQKARLIAERQLLYEQYLRTKKALDKAYSVNILYGKYHHDFPAVASFLDYFKSGRCSTLGENRGGDGAYNTYEAELLQHRILNKLDRILEKLDEIKSNQWTIYSAIQDGNRISDDLFRETKRLSDSNEDNTKYSAIAAYNAQEAANELNQIKWIELLKLK